VTGTIEGAIVEIQGSNITVTAVGFPSHGAPFNFTVTIRLEAPYTMAGFSAAPGITWTVNGDVLTITGEGTVEWGDGLGNAWG
jgi:hypothetical protein